MKYQEIERPAGKRKSTGRPRGETAQFLDAIEETTVTGRALHVDMLARDFRMKYASQFSVRQRAKNEQDRLRLHVWQNGDGIIAWATKREQI